jgi:hypothetical protein
MATASMLVMILIPTTTSLVGLSEGTTWIAEAALIRGIVDDEVVHRIVLMIVKIGSNDLTIAIFIMVGMAERIRASAVEKVAATLIVVKTADTFVISSRLMDMTSTTTIIIITMMNRLVDIGVVVGIDWRARHRTIDVECSFFGIGGSFLNMCILNH